MSEHTEALRGREVVLAPDGTVKYVLVPMPEYLELTRNDGAVLGPDGEVLDVPDTLMIPGEVAKRRILDEVPMLRAWREHLGLTQKDVAERMGISSAAYSEMERGKKNLRIDTLRRIAEAMGVSDWRKLVE